jgi:hypothetical protein
MVDFSSLSFNLTPPFPLYLSQSVIWRSLTSLPIFALIKCSNLSERQKRRSTQQRLIQTIMKKKALTAIDLFEPRQVIRFSVARKTRILLVVMLVLFYLWSILDPWFLYQQLLAGLPVRIPGPADWDYLFLSGYALVFLGLWLSLDLNQKSVHAIERLATREALNKDGGRLNPPEVESIGKVLHENSYVWAHRIATPLAIALPIIFVMGLSLSSDPATSFLIFWGVSGFLGGYVVGYVLGWMSSYAVLGNFLLRM